MTTLLGVTLKIRIMSFMIQGEQCMSNEQEQVSKDTSITEVEALFAAVNSTVIPFFTLEEFADKIRLFIDYLRIGKNRQSLIYTGYPALSFSECLWLFDILSRLYPTRIPYSTQGTKPGDKNILKQDPDKDGNISFRYIWLREYFGEPISSFQSCLRNRQTGKHLQVPLFNPYENECDYEVAPHIRGFGSKDVMKIEELRPRLLNLKLQILEIALDQIKAGESEGFWDKCFSAVIDKITGEEFRFLNEIESKYMGVMETGVFILGEDDPWSPANFGRTVDFDAGGLNGMIQFIYHVEQELSYRKIHDIKSRLNQASEGDVAHSSELLEELVRFLNRNPKAIEEHSKEFKIMFDKRIKYSVEDKLKTPLMISVQYIDLYKESLRILEQIHLLPGCLPSKFVVEDGTRWEDIRIEFINETDVYVITPSGRKLTNCKDLEFYDNRANRPNKGWELLIKFARNKGILIWEQSFRRSDSKSHEIKASQIATDNLSVKRKCYIPDKQKVEKCNLSKKLKSIFDINTEPITTDRNGKCYRMRIKLIYN